MKQELKNVLVTFGLVLSTVIGGSFAYAQQQSRAQIAYEEALARERDQIAAANRIEALQKEVQQDLQDLAVQQEATQPAQPADSETTTSAQATAAQIATEQAVLAAKQKAAQEEAARQAALEKQQAAKQAAAQAAAKKAAEQAMQQMLARQSRHSRAS